MVGIAGNISQREEKAFETLLFLDTLRGHHSTGLFRVRRYLSAEVDVLKEEGTPYDGLFKLPEYKKFYQPWSKILAGHNRYATMGKINKENAHPFEIGAIVGMHNGTIRNRSLMDDFKDFEVDSENIIYCIDKIGIEETVKKLCGAFALVWYNKDDQTLNFIRNSERPLFYAFTQDGKSLFWASEDWMITAASQRHKIPVDEIRSFELMTLYSMSMERPDNNTGVFKAGEMNKFLCRKLKGYEPPARRYWSDNLRGNTGRLYTEYDDDYDTHGAFRGRSQSTSFRPGKSATSLTAPTPPALPSPKSFDLYKKAEGKEVPFRVASIISGSRGGTYIRGFTTGDNPDLIAGLETRIYLASNSHEWKEYGQIGSILRARVKRARNIEGGYLLLDRRTLSPQKNVEIPVEGFEDDLPEDLSGDGINLDDYFKVGQAGYYVTLQDFKRLVKDGCAVCTDMILTIDADDLEWIYDDRPICVKCQSDWNEENALWAERRQPPPAIH